jgi:alpha-glucosidase (family GH31 glycosyl hydrolase)
MLRAMMLEFPDDPACDYLDRQYMLGDSVLVAPVFSEAGDVQFWLPEGAGRICGITMKFRVAAGISSITMC